MRHPFRPSTHRPRLLAVAARTGAAIALALALALIAGGSPGTRPPATLAADPPTPLAGVTSSAPNGGDTRSPGEGAGLAGAPALAVGAVAAIGLASALVTLAYVRLTGGTGAVRR